MSVKYENFPTDMMVEQATYEQLRLWVNFLPEPLTRREELIYNRIVERRDEYYEDAKQKGML